MTCIKRWSKFERVVRNAGMPLLKELNEFSGAVLVAGCQRSGTTILARIISQSKGMATYRYTKDDELDAALILSGAVAHTESARHCFQTTYLNANYKEYFDYTDYKLIWVIRRPTAVVYSMLYNWRRGALNRLFNGCGAKLLRDDEKKIYEMFGTIAISRIRKACLSYNAKQLQLKEISPALGSRRLLVVDYDELVLNQEDYLRAMFEFAGLEWEDRFAKLIHRKSLSKSKVLSSRYANIVSEVCDPLYEQSKAYLTKLKNL